MSRHGPSPDMVAALLTQFPAPVILHPSKLKWVVLLALMAVLLGCSVLFLLPVFPHLPIKGFVIVAICMVAPVLLLIVLAAVTLGRDMPRITLDTDGIEVSETLWGVYRWRWSEVGPFHSFWFLAITTDTSEPRSGWDRFQRACLYAKYRIWTDTFGLGAKNLARLMNGWRERAMVQQP